MRVPKGGLRFGALWIERMRWVIRFASIRLTLSVTRFKFADFLSLSLHAGIVEFHSDQKKRSLPAPENIAARLDSVGK